MLATRGLGKSSSHSGSFLATRGLGKGQPLGPARGGHTPFKGIRNIAAWVKVVPEAELLVNYRLHPIADGNAPTAQGGYGFIACTSREQPLADAVCCFTLPTQQHEYFPPEAKGEANCEVQLLEDHYADQPPTLTGEADAEASIFTFGEAALNGNPQVPASGIKNPSDEELVFMINTIRRRRR